MDDYDTVSSAWEELYEEYCRESDRLFFEWQYDMRRAKLENDREGM